MFSKLSNQIAEHARALASVPEEMLAYLRAEGVDKGSSIRAYSDIYAVSLERAKAAVHMSPVWADSRKADELLHERIIRALNTEPKPAARFRPRR